MALPMRPPPRRDVFSALSRTAGRAAMQTRQQFSGSRAGALARSASTAIKTRTKLVYSAVREPASAALQRGGVELGGHGAAYTLDRVFQWRAWGGWMRPSFFFTVGSFVLAALTGGKWSKMFANVGAGGVHHYAARSFDKLNNLLSPGASSGTEGTEGAGSDAY